MTTEQFPEISTTDNNNFTYKTFENDPNKVRIYTLKNGLQVFLAQNFDAPKIQTYIPVKTGSNNDPKDNTGLSHYLEHMMFKGTSKLGSANWEEEKKYLDQISDLYEAHKEENDPEKKKVIYKKIDQVSQKASEFAIANEYDKAISSLGATGTNAHTWLDETVYKNNIPNNELEKWLKIEKERFSELTLRLFHTELESVYEEFNRAQDNDGRISNYALMELLFPTHPNGQQTTLGKAEHLKNPSMKAIHQYYDDFYVPNNYAMVLVGDFEFDETIKLVDDYFGKLKSKELPLKEKIEEKPLNKIQKKVVRTPTIARVQIAWRTKSYGSRESQLADICANILTNSGEAGLLDLNINQAQKALYAQAFSTGFKIYGYFSAVIVPKEEQNLDEGIAMLLEQINLIKKGEFPDWLLEAVFNDFKLQRLKALKTADGLASNLYDTYIKGRSWQQELEEMSEYESITKEEIVTFANDFFKENYVAVYKEKGENEDLIRVDNPGITPIKINRDTKSDFLKEILAQKPLSIKPYFIDYKKEIESTFIREKKISFIKNKENDLAQVHYIFPFGSDHDKELGLATQVLQYLGTPKFTADELNQEFYKLGISNDFKTSPNELRISLTGLEANISKGMALLHLWMSTAKPEQETYLEFVNTILESREAAKKDKTRIFSALVNYAKFGKTSRTRDVISEDNLKNIKVKDLTDKIKKIFSFPYQIFFYGKDFYTFKSVAEPFIKPELFNIPEPRIYPEPETSGKVYFADYEMVQLEMSKVAKGNLVDIENFGKINVFNEYFGSGLSSIIFQELRESKSLAYSAYVSYAANAEISKPDYISTYIGTQPDKLKIAVDAMDDLMKDLPQVEFQFTNSKNSALKKIEAGRLTRTNVFFNALRLQKLGVDYDLREKVYHETENLTLKDLTDFYNSNIKPLKFNTAIIGKKENLDMEAVENLGEFQELSLEEIFGY
ncbi:M16 family metallopeptidase [Halpernia frigidisoli]|uniref:Predicted Zn-dependent peptidase n=1 Tax=Halpernia frigidisoli TaxID=1125876 RepID=A0A1I3DIY1_9FLAO|nr:M16 family metallopeptidase [Halpernia frigidisoli]SFH86697.1 Predicted Zn-dependent peptidase [Halpernia frigidisoli]